MNTLISLGNTYAAAAADRGAAGRSVGLDAQLTAARRQLQDRMTRSSAKTPEGKAKIREYTDKLELIRARVKQADAEAAQVRRFESTQSGDTLGVALDTYA